MEKIQVQGVHHITLVGATRQASIDFWEGVLGMPFIFEQPNLDNPDESHLYFDPGDGRLITVFTNESRAVDPRSNSEDVGHVHHLAFSVSRATFVQIPARLEARGVPHTGAIDRGFMDSIYFRDPLGQRERRRVDDLYRIGRRTRHVQEVVGRVFHDTERIDIDGTAVNDSEARRRNDDHLVQFAIGHV